MYELVLIDADYTLFDFARAEDEALERTLKDYSYSGEYIAVINLYKEINRKLWIEYENGMVTKEDLKYLRFARTFDIYGITYDIDAFSEKYIHFLSNGYYLYEGAIELCKYLQGKYKVMIVTNGLKAVQKNRFELSGINQYIIGQVISEEVGANKPDSRIFESACHQAQVFDKKKVIMIGDSLSADIKGGNAFGIDTVWYNPTQEINNTVIKPTHEVVSYKNIMQIL